MLEEIDLPALQQICAAFAVARPQIEAIASGNINRSFAVVGSRADMAGRRFVLQRLNPIFRPEMHHDIARVTEYLSARGMATSRLCATRSGELWHQDPSGHAWRLQTFVDGEVHLRITEPDLARAAGTLLGRFHLALGDLHHTFQFARQGVHDTPAHLGRLREGLVAGQGHPAFAKIEPVAAAILAGADALPALGGLPSRIVHGDPKVENMVFAADGRGLAMIDLDTLNCMPTLLELGDALRSWCNPDGENAAVAGFRSELMVAALQGYHAGSGNLLSNEERALIPVAVATITLELAARFALDALEERYFRWDRQRFAAAWEHNLLRASNQLQVWRAMPERRAQKA